MPAPYRDKNILEMSDREREARRLADLERPGRDAIEGVYPEEFIVPGIKRGLDSLRALQAARTAKTQRAISNLQMPGEAQPNVYRRFPEEPKGDLFFDPVRRTPKEAAKAKAAIEARKQENERFNSLSRSEQRLDKLRRWEENLDKRDAATQAALAPSRAAGLFAAGDEQEYKRGGAVKSKAFRGDGIAQRGKTKGRFV